MTVTATHVGLVGVGVGAKVGAIVRRICAGVEFNFAPRPVRKILGRSEVYGGARSITVDNVTRPAVGTRYRLGPFMSSYCFIEHESGLDAELGGNFAA